jgi:hypothetical protein
MTIPQPDEMTKSDIRTARAFKVFAWACLIVGFAMLMLEAFLHYRSSFMRNPPPPSAWSAVGIMMGAMLLLFGAGALQFAITQKAISIIGYILPIAANALSAMRPGGKRATDPAPLTPAADVAVDTDVDAILAAEAEARRAKHAINPPIAAEDG